mgnify:CR=1 FL=1
MCAAIIRNVFDVPEERGWWRRLGDRIGRRPRPVARQRNEAGGWLRGDFPLAAESRPGDLSDRVWSEYNGTAYRHPLSGAVPGDP